MGALRDGRRSGLLPVVRCLLDAEIEAFDFGHFIRGRFVRRIGMGRFWVLLVRWIVDEEAIVLENVQSGERVFVKEWLAESGLTESGLTKSSKSGF
ncbi:MAG TPA: hypothetical protein VN876_05915, partial [Gemmatimonadaceae bacterium]|nr:hypothetical protein [Gemmatimonadaceae bacterium]